LERKVPPHFFCLNSGGALWRISDFFALKVNFRQKIVNSPRSADSGQFSTPHSRTSCVYGGCLPLLGLRPAMLTLPAFGVVWPFLTLISRQKNMKPVKASLHTPTGVLYKKALPDLARRSLNGEDG
jgi:hypothetical protein